MTVNDLLRPRFVLGVIAIIILAGLIYTQSIDSTVGITVIIGVLAALGVYEGISRQRRK